MSDDFYLQAGSQRLVQIEAERAAALADLAAHKANHDSDSAAAAIQQIANLDVELSNLNNLYSRYVQSQNPPPPEPSPEERAARPVSHMDWQDVVNLARQSKYARDIKADDPALLEGWRATRSSVTTSPCRRTTRGRFFCASLPVQRRAFFCFLASGMVAAYLVRRSGITAAVVASFEQNRAHSPIKRRRFSNRSPRRYAASTLSPIVWASAISTT
jgi:hypothetical protein